MIAVYFDRYQANKRAKQDPIVLHTPGKEEKASIYTHLPSQPLLRNGLGDTHTHTRSLSHTHSSWASYHDSSINKHRVPRPPLNGLKGR